MQRIALLLIIGCAHVADASGDVAYMRERIRAFHGSATNAHRTLRLVYFQPANVEPQAGFRERIPRIMTDIQDFYRSEMERIGYGAVVFPMELVDGQPRIHVVTGRGSADAYDYGSGADIMREVDVALGDDLTIGHDFVLIIHNLCRKREDGSYFVHAPYYGDGASNHRRGLCHAADCELLDPTLFTEKKRKIVYEEHTGTFEQTLAEFNVKYIGGVAHELGHGLGLPHNRQTPEETRRLGTALMGAGNHTYRRELQGRKGSFLSLASATRLASHPLFTRSDHGRQMPVSCETGDLTFSAEASELVIEGSLNATPEVYGLVAYVDPEGGGDYDARTVVVPVRDGQFTLRAGCGEPARYALRLVACHVNGAASTFYRGAFAFSGRYAPIAETLTARRVVQGVVKTFLDGRQADAAEEAREILGTETVPASAVPRLQHLIALATGEAGVTTNRNADGDLYLSDVPWVSARVGWGRPARNHYYYGGHIRDALLLEFDGTFYSKGLYAHAPSEYVFDIGPEFKRFTAEVGLQEGVAHVGSAVFTVKGDGKKLYQSPLLKGSQTADVDIEIEGVKRLELLVESGKEGNACCWSIWGNPRVSRENQP